MVKRRGGTKARGFDETVGRGELLRAFAKVAVYAAPAVLIASQIGCDESTGGGGDGDDDADCSVSGTSISCSSSESESASSSEECVLGVDCAVPT